MRSLACLALVTAAFLLGAPQAQSIQPTDTARPLQWLHDPDGDGPVAVGQVVAGSSTLIQRSTDAVEFEITTSGLVPTHGHTVWFFSYDNPSMCISSHVGMTDGSDGNKCSVVDLLFNPAALGSLMWGRAGAFVESDEATFAGSRPRNAVPCATEPAVADAKCGGVLFGRGLMDPMKAEIHFVIRDHGPDQAGVPDETSSINGGCDPTAIGTAVPIFHFGWGTPGNYACNDPQGN